MNRIVSLNTLLVIATITTASTFCKRPRKEKPPKQPRPALSQEQKEIIGSNIAQVMGGLCTIAQDPHNHYTLGTSIASMIHALINIIVEKFAHRTKKISCKQDLELYLNELYLEISKEITEIIITKNLLHRHKIYKKNCLIQTIC